MIRKSILACAIAATAFCVNAKEIKKVVIIGNSIRLHGPSQKLGWTGNWGMAATSQDKDYAHVLFKKICDKVAKTQTSAPKLEMPVGTVAERDLSKWSAEVTKDADIIIIQLGDNYRGKVTEEDLQTPYAAMVKDYKGDRSPIVICVSTWGKGKKNSLIEAAAKSQGAKFVSLEKASSDPQNKAKSEGHFTHGGVNWHPGDRGMQAIADAIWEVLEPEIDQNAKAPNAK